MRYDDPNRPEPLEPLNPKPKYLETEPAGDKAHAGYERIARRPRTRGYNEIVPEERADRIEGIFSTPPGFDMDSY